MTQENGEPAGIKLVGAVVQAVRLLQTIEQHDRALGVSALARSAGVNPSTAFNILRTLNTLDFVNFDAGAKTYSLGSGLLKLAEGLVGQSVIDVIRPEVEQLANDTNSFVGMWQITDDRLVLIDRAVPDSPMRLELALKHRMPLMLGALGRAMAAEKKLSDAKLRAAFKPLRWEGVIDVGRYIEEVREAERVGYAVDREALYRGVVSIGALVRDRDGKPVYGLTSSAILSRFREEDIPVIGRRMAKLGQSLVQR